MTTKFTHQEVKKIARLSSLDLTEKEIQVFAEQFSTILEYFEILQDVEISDGSRDINESHLINGREDKVVKSNVSPEQFSPYLEKGFFKVPKVIDPNQ
tara:strand:- start:35 stop:328 length:294 start_codon:yes stop_codon:yes gene_type:complete